MRRCVQEQDDFGYRVDLFKKVGTSLYLLLYPTPVFLIRLQLPPHMKIHPMFKVSPSTHCITGDHYLACTWWTGKVQLGSPVESPGHIPCTGSNQTSRVSCLETDKTRQDKFIFSGFSTEFSIHRLHTVMRGP